MAITILQTPALFGPGFNDQNWLVSSNNTGNTNFQFIAEVCDSSGNTLVKLKRPAESGTTKAWFNVQRIVEAYLSTNFSHDDTAAATNSDSYYRYLIKFGEEYGTTVTEYLNLTTSSTVYVWSAALRTYEFPLFTLADWQYDNAATTKGRFLAPIRGQYPTTLDNKGCLWLLQKTTAPPDRVKVIAYNAGGTATTSVFTTGLTANTAANTLIRIPAHPYNLNAIGSLTSGTPGSVIPSDTEYYTVQMFNSTTAMGEIFRFNVNCSGQFSTPVYVYWLNRYGGYDVFCFDGNNQFNSTTQRKHYTRNHRTVGTSTYDFTSRARGKAEFYIDTRETMSLTSRWLSADEAELLDGLATSPSCYVLKDGNVYAMNVLTERHQRKTGEEYEAFQYSFELEYSLLDYSQRL